MHFPFCFPGVTHFYVLRFLENHHRNETRMSILFHNQYSNSNNGRPFKFEKRERIIANDADPCRWLVLSTQDTFGIQNYWRCIGNNQGKHQGQTQQEKQEGKQTSKARAWMARAWEFDATIPQNKQNRGCCFPKLFGDRRIGGTIVEARFINDSYLERR